MNKKLIFYVFAILMAFTLTFSCVSAAENDTLQSDDSLSASDDVTLAKENTVQAQENGSADLVIDIENAEIEDDIVWAITVVNKGPDTAVNTGVLTYGSDNLFILDYMASVGEFDPITGIWEIGDLANNDYAILILDTLKVGSGPYYVEALVVSDTPDPNVENNYAISYVGLDSAAASAAEETLPATGNPLVVALLALMAIGIGGLKRRF